MPFIVIALGAIMLLCGIAALVLGLPYLVLERGFTQVIMGGVVATGGVVVMIGGLILKELKQVRLAAAANIASKSALPAPAGLAIAASAILAGTIAATSQAATSDNADAKDDEQPMLPFIDEEAASADDTAQEVTAVSSDDNQVSQNGETGQTALDNATNAYSSRETAADNSSAVIESAEQSSTVQENLAEILDADSYDPITPHAPSLDANPVLNDAYTDLRNSLQSEFSVGDEISHDKTGHEITIPMANIGAVDKNNTASEEQIVSSEGVVSVRQIGDSTYTMFSDGTVRAATPAGERMFNSIAELKTHLALGS